MRLLFVFVFILNNLCTLSYWENTHIHHAVRRVDFPEITILNFSTIAGMLRLSNKYGLDRLKSDIISRLKKEWPASLSSHLEKNRAFTQKLTPAQPVQGQVPAPLPVIDVDQDLIVHPAAVIAVLREVKCTDAVLMTPLFYDLSRRIWQLAGATSGHHLGPLDSSDVERLLIGVARLRTSHMMRASATTLVMLPSQEHQGTCGLRWGATYIPALNRVLIREGNLMSEPVEDWEAAKLYVKAIPPLEQQGICAGCKELIVKYVEEQQKLIWASLAASFELVVG